MSLLNDVSIVVTPNGYKAGELYAVVPVPTEGAEEITNGDFATDSDWTKGTGWSISGGTANCIGGAGSLNLTQVALEIGKRYTVTYTVSNYSTGTIHPIIGGWTHGTYQSSNGTYTEVISNNHASANTTFYMQGKSGFVGSIDNVSVKEYTSADMDVTRATAATRVDENGLVNYAEIIGAEELTNGDFATDSDWTKGTGWAIGVDKAIYTGTANSNLEQGSILNSGINYILNYEVISSTLSGGIVKLSGETASAQNVLSQVAGTHSLIFTANGSSPEDFKIRIVVNTSGSYEITNISVKEIQRDNVPRIDYTGGGCPHILAEPQRTNLVTYSEDFSQWTLTNGTLTPNATVSPDGTQNAGKVVFNNTGVDLKRTITVVAGQTYTISFYIKLESGTGLDGRFYDNSNGANIDVYDYTSQIQGTEWSRITRSVTAPSGCTEMQIWLLASSSSLVTASFWGAQFELGSYPTSLIPTSGSTVTRNQDIFTRDGIGSLINSTEGVLFVEMAALSNDGTYRQLTLSDGTTANRILVDFTNASNQIRVFCGSGGVSQVSETFNVTSSLSFNKIAFKYKLNDFALWVNGVEVATDTSGITPIGLNKLSFNNGAGSFDFYGKVKQLQVFKTALSDSELVTLTT